MRGIGELRGAESDPTPLKFSGLRLRTPWRGGVSPARRPEKRNGGGRVATARITGAGRDMPGDPNHLSTLSLLAPHCPLLDAVAGLHGVITGISRETAQGHLVRDAMLAHYLQDVVLDLG